MFGLGIPEVLVILVVALLVFGPRKLPEIGSALGRGIRDFKKGLEGAGDEAKGETKQMERKAEDSEQPSQQS